MKQAIFGLALAGMFALTAPAQAYNGWYCCGSGWGYGAPTFGYEYPMYSYPSYSYPSYSYPSYYSQPRYSQRPYSYQPSYSYFYGYSYGYSYGYGGNNYPYWGW